MNVWMHIAGWVLVHFVWQGAVVAIAAVVILHAYRHRSALVRYVIACSAMVTMLLGAVATAALIEAPAADIEAKDVSVRRTSGGTVEAFLPIQISTAPSPGAVSNARRIETLLPWIVSAWLFGVTFLLGRAAAGWWRVRRLHLLALASTCCSWQTAGNRIASRLGLARFIRIVKLPQVDVPLVVGCLRPIVVLPIAAISQLNAAQVEAILAHELAHIRRHDYLVNLMQTLAETLLFYHPAVWWLSARIRDEREHCCDDVAVAVCGDPAEYAAALTELEAWRSGRLGLATAATGGSLLNRVRRILRVDMQEDSRMWPWTIGLVAAAAVSALVPNLAAQTSVTVQSDLRFEVASVKPNNSGSPNANMQLHPGGRITATNTALLGLIRNIFNLQPYQLINAPDWIETARFDIEAKADREYSAREDAPSPELITMLRNLLADRFKLVVHRETREMSVYSLVRAKSDGSLGPQIRRSQVDCESEAARALAARRGQASSSEQAGQKPLLRCNVRTNAGRIVATGQTVSQVMRYLSSPLGRAVVDRTGLDGAFDLELRWTPEPSADTPGPSLFTAVQEQLGFKLESTRGPVEVLIIDHIERPTPD